MKEYFIAKSAQHGYYLCNSAGDVLCRNKSLKAVQTIAREILPFNGDNRVLEYDNSVVVYNSETDQYTTKNKLQEVFITDPDYEDQRREYIHFNLWFNEITGKNGSMEII